MSLGRMSCGWDSDDREVGTLEKGHYIYIYK